MKTIILSSLLGPVLATTAFASLEIREPAGTGRKASSTSPKRGAHRWRVSASSRQSTAAEPPEPRAAQTSKTKRSDPVTPPTTLAQAFADICVMDGPLSRKLTAYSDKLRELNFPFAEVYDVLGGRLIDGAIGSDAPKVGEPMPPFALPARNGGLVRLDDCWQMDPW